MGIFRQLNVVLPPRLGHNVRAFSGWLTVTSCKTILSLAILVLCSSASAQQYKILCGFGSGADGAGVWDSVVFDTKGNLYGTTSGGGTYGYGTIFELTPNGDGTWAESVLHSFMDNDPDGDEPTGGLATDAAGNLYGTTALGGAYAYDGGTVFELTPGSGGWSLTVLHSFPSSSADAIKPYAGLIMDKAGNLYGTAPYGGTNVDGGIVFKLTPGIDAWAYNVLYSFCTQSNCGDGNAPFAGLIADAVGNLYGTTESGGSPAAGFCRLPGCGVVFEVSPASGDAWKERVLHKFGSSHNDGEKPGVGNLVFDNSGNLYGTTFVGGKTGCTTGCGTVFKLTRESNGQWQETMLYDFKNGPTGNGPGAGVVIDQAGNLYGTTGYGGSAACDCGVVYKLAPGPGGTWTYSVLHTFTGPDGFFPDANLILRNGNLYGTTAAGGPHGGGVVFEVIP